MKTLSSIVVAVAALGLAGAANATVTLTAGQFGGTGVHSTSGLSAPTVTGLAGTDVVTLSTVGDLLDTSGGGESKFTAHDGVIDDLSIAFTFDYDSVTFNLNVPKGKATTDFTLSVNGGAFNFTETGLGNGENKFRLDATGTDFIHTLAFTFTGAGVEDVRQVRVGDIVGGVVTHGVPEPTTWALMISGFGMAGAMFRRRRAVLAA